MKGGEGENEDEKGEEGEETKKGQARGSLFFI
jgi:hypothetical protein